MSTRAVRRLRGASVIMVCAGLWLVGACAPIGSPGAGHDARQDLKAAGPLFPNTPLLTQEGRPVRFYDDLVKGKTVLVNFIYTSCQKSCSPTTANLARLHGLLGDRVGRDLFLLSISLDPAVDRPATLREYAARFGQFRGWYFLTGNEREIDDLRRRLGLYDLDPVIDRDKTQHAGIVVAGNDTTNRWLSLPALMDPRQLAQAVLRITRNGRDG